MSISEEAGNHLQGNGSRTLDVQNVRPDDGTRGTFEMQTDDCQIGSRKEAGPSRNEGNYLKQKTSNEIRKLLPTTKDQIDFVSRSSQTSNAEPSPSATALWQEPASNALVSYPTTNKIDGTSHSNDNSNDNSNGKLIVQSQASNRHPPCASDTPKSKTDISVSGSSSAIMPTVNVSSSSSSSILMWNHADSALIRRKRSPEYQDAAHTQEQNTRQTIQNNMNSLDQEKQHAGGIAVQTTSEARAESFQPSSPRDSRMALPTIPSPALKRPEPGDVSKFTQKSNQDSAEPRHCQLDLPLTLRNKKMKPTDCLLFAATLLENDATQFPSTANAPSLMMRSAGATLNTASVATLGPLASASPIQKNTGGGDNVMIPRDVDVLCGRGGLINKHSGNIVYRRVVEFNKPYYQSVHKKHRILVSQSIVQSILNFGGRFLISTGDKGKPWVEIDFKRAVQKTSQALRERNSGTHDDDQNTKNDDQHQPMESKGQEDESAVDDDHDREDPSNDVKQHATQNPDKDDHGFNGTKYEAI